MPSSTPKISDAEWDVMNLLWQHRGLSLAQIVRELEASNQWSARTIRTLLDRLIAKRCVRRQLSGKRPVYSAALGREACLRQASTSFLDRVFGGEPAAMLVHLVQSKRLSGADIQELRKILEAKEDKEP